MENSLVIIKPDGIARGFVGKVITRFEERGFKIISIKMILATKKNLDLHYSHLIKRSFYSNIIEYMTMGPIVVLIINGINAVSTIRKMLGTTNPLDSPLGTIRGDYCLDVGRNLCHASDSVDNAKKEINIWFDKEEILDYNFQQHNLIYQNKTG